MSRNRFLGLLSILSFDDYSTREERKTADPKFFKMSYVLDRFKKKISTAYEPGSNLCIDETLTTFRGKMNKYINASFFLLFFNFLIYKENARRRDKIFVEC